EREPQRPHVLKAGVDRDLETVSLKCLEKEPARRYRSAEALAEDLERWLRGEPIDARPVGRAERTGRWGRRDPALAARAATWATPLAAAAAGASRSAAYFRPAAEQERAAAAGDRALARAADDARHAADDARQDAVAGWRRAREIALAREGA